MDKFEIGMLWFVIGFLIIWVVGYFVIDDCQNSSDKYLQSIEQLAQSICDQEYNMDYKSYDDGKLTCKPKEIEYERQYDGIVIQIGGG